MKEKIQGCFFGLATGDALGVPVEFRDREFLQDRPVTEMTGFGTWNQPAGTWSDDSSLAFCLAESLVNGYDLMDIGQKFVAWYTRGYWGAHHRLFDIGGTTRVALARIRDGAHPLMAGEFDESSNGNGSLMRMAPAAIYFSQENDNSLYQRIHEISSITHAHFRSAVACFIFSKLLIGLFHRKDKFMAYQDTVSAVKQFAAEKEFNPDEMKHFHSILSGQIEGMNAENVESSGYVVHTLEASIWCLLTTSSFSEAVLKAVNLGGDTDTTGCVTGALAGTYYGVDAIPLAWRHTLAREKDIAKLAEHFTESLKKKILR